MLNEQPLNNERRYIRDGSFFRSNSAGVPGLWTSEPFGGTRYHPI
jgi:hypothetical protein